MTATRLPETLSAASGHPRRPLRRRWRSSEARVADGSERLRRAAPPTSRATEPRPSLQGRGAARGSRLRPAKKSARFTPVLSRAVAGLLTALPLVARALLWLAAGAVVGVAAMLLTAFLLEAETPVVFCIVGGALAGLLFVELPVATPGGAALPTT